MKESLVNITNSKSGNDDLPQVYPKGVGGIPPLPQDYLCLYLHLCHQQSPELRPKTHLTGIDTH